MTTPHHHSKFDPFFITSAAENLVFRRWSAVATLALLVWEHAITLQTELRYIWRRPISIVKGIYVFSRYYALAIQIFNLYLVSGPLSSLEIPEHVCRRWFLFLTASSCALLATVDAILMLRVYALYLQDVKAGMFLAALFFGQLMVEFIYVPIVVKVPFDPICDAQETHKGVVYFGISLWVKHLAVVAMTLAKRDLAVLGAPVVRLVRRDGMWVVVLICGFFTAIIPYSFVNQVSKAHVAFGWPMTILSISCCRMITNMLQLRINPDEETETGGSITTDLSNNCDAFSLHSIDSNK
ncbi:hypothetical protein BDN70DRAFT_190965 [Pholiota conissans]|uniref:DUF6533 domain-containing protein n=1 Tax=Pholiota conissans TaxID=109636 RepID=A0A9P6CXB8_9AGAR|nr:hypothetical protein BDN70DRAFT_190965 [Pholiota conissans]